MTICNMPRYRVTMKVQYPAWDEKHGLTVEVEAKTRALAIKTGRGVLNHGGNINPFQGRRTFTAHLIPDTDAEP